MVMMVERKRARGRARETALAGAGCSAGLASSTSDAASSLTRLAVIAGATVEIKHTTSSSVPKLAAQAVGNEVDRDVPSSYCSLRIFRSKTVSHSQ